MRLLWADILGVAVGILSACAGTEPAPGIDAGRIIADAAPRPASDASSGFLDAGFRFDGGTAVFDSGHVFPGGDASPAPAYDASASADASSGPVQDQCNPLTQNDCPMATSKCVVEEGPAICVSPGQNDLGLGAPCSGFACQPMLACVMDQTQMSTCQHLCDINGSGEGCEALGNDYDCRARLSGTNWGLCVHLGPICQPISQAPCPMDQACTPSLRSTGLYEFRCRLAGTQGDGQPCGSPNLDCQRGFACVRPTMGGTAVCRKFCDMTNQCPAMQSCSGMVLDPPFHFCEP